LAPKIAGKWAFIKINSVGIVRGLRNAPFCRAFGRWLHDQAQQGAGRGAPETRNLPNRFGKNAKVFLAWAELAAIRVA
jgi:hypothetical protein